MVIRGILIFNQEFIKLSSEDDDDIEFINKAKIIPQKNRVYLGLPIEIVTEYSLRENKIIWTSPSGQILFTYHKAKPTPGEGDDGDGIIKYFDSPYGRIGSSICFDVDFPFLINQVNNMDINIIFEFKAELHAKSPLLWNFMTDRVRLEPMALDYPF